MTIFDIQKICTNLTELKYDSAYPIPDDKVEEALVLMDKQIRRVDNNRTITETDSSSPLYFNRNLKVLELSIPSLTTSYIQYFIKHLPVHLDKVMVKIGTDTAVELAQHLSAINTVGIVFSHDNERQETPGTESKMTRYFRFIATLKGDRQMYTAAHFQKFHSSEVAIKAEDTRKMMFSYTYTHDELLAPFKMPFPNASKTVIGLEIINHLSLSIRRLGNKVPVDTLKYALTNCPNLQMFELNWLGASSKICVSHIGDHSKDIKDCDPSRTFQESLKRIKLEGQALLSNELLGLLSTHLPDVENLVCAGGQSTIEVAGNDTYNFDWDKTLDMTGLGSLNTFCLDCWGMIYDRRDHFFIHFEYANSGEEDCYYIELLQCAAKFEYSKVTPITLDLVKEFRKQPIPSTLVSFECSKPIKEIAICSGEIIIAYIVDRQLQIIDSDDRGYYKRFFY